MIKIDAPTLEGAYRKASEALECSIAQLQCEVIQHPSKGLFGLFKKDAIIIASCKPVESTSHEAKPQATPVPKVSPLKSQTPTKEPKAPSEYTPNTQSITKPQNDTKTLVLENDTIVDHFFEPDFHVETQQGVESEEEGVLYPELAQLIEDQLKSLLAHSCFDIDVVEVDVKDNMALIFIDGNDAALLIGKEGYRYNALSYMIFNWLHSKYELFIKLEIAAFLTSQQEMIRNYIKPVIETVQKQGRGKTRYLDGILVQIALEQLREQFPDKYVAIKTSREGKRFVVINEFNNSTKTYA